MIRWILAALAAPVLSVGLSLASEGLLLNDRQMREGIAQAPAFSRQGLEDYEEVPLVRLLATPERYDGRKVSVSGYVTLQSEGNGIHLDKAAHLAGLHQHAIWLDQPKWLPHAEGRRFTRRYAVVTGVFSASHHGHLGLYAGGLTDVQRIITSLTQADYEQMRLGWIHDALIRNVFSPWFLTPLLWATLALFWLARRRTT